jgi:hypothetical protein
MKSNESEPPLALWEEITRDEGEASPFAANIPFDRPEIIAEITRRREEREDEGSSIPAAS